MTSAERFPSGLRVAAPLALGALLAGACGGATQEPPRSELVAVPQATADAGRAPALVPDAGAPASEATDAGAPATAFSFSGKNLCGCKLCEPVVSDDSCATDADCAPATPCHATTCIAASKVTPPARPPMCTRVLLCNTTDANSCLCYKGKCALGPRPVVTP